MFAFYTAVWLSEWGHGTVLATALVLSGLSVLPVRFVYPNRAPRWRRLFVGGGIAWLAVIGAILWYYPEAPIPHGLLWLSAVYPVFYVAASLYLDWQLRAGLISSIGQLVMPVAGASSSKPSNPSEPSEPLKSANSPGRMKRWRSGPGSALSQCCRGAGPDLILLSTDGGSPGDWGQPVIGHGRGTGRQIHGAAREPCP